MTTDGVTSGTFVPLTPTDVSAAGRAGCMLLLAGLTLLPGDRILAAFVVNPDP